MRIIFNLLISCYLLISCSAQTTSTDNSEQSEKKSITESKFELADFYTDNSALDSAVESWYQSLNDTQRVAQLIMTSAGELGKPQKTVSHLVDKQYVGGVIFLKGSVNGNKSFISQLNEASATPLWFAIDAEPSLFNSRVKGSNVSISKTLSLETEQQVKSTAHTIDSVILDMGFHINFAPVVDLSPDNEAIKDRSFGSDPQDVIQKSSWFIEASSKDQVMTCVKHFPGHGYVKGDTHEQAVFVDGELKEVPVYPPLFEKGVLSTMVAHVAVKNNEQFNTNDKPASCSRNIVTDLLRDSLGFQGIVFTDAMNMMAAQAVGASAPLQALQAGCDVVLMPPNEFELLQEILNTANTDEIFAHQIKASIKRILRAKVCLGIQPKM